MRTGFWEIVIDAIKQKYSLNDDKFAKSIYATYIIVSMPYFISYIYSVIYIPLC